MNYVACEALQSMGFPRQEYWNGLPYPSPGDFSYTGIKPTSPALAGGFFTTEPPGKTVNSIEDQNQTGLIKKEYLFTYLQAKLFI